MKATTALQELNKKAQSPDAGMLASPGAKKPAKKPAKTPSSPVKPGAKKPAAGGSAKKGKK